MAPLANLSGRTNLSGLPARVHDLVRKNVVDTSGGHLVWCHERCHKPDKDAERDDITAAASEAGFQTVLMTRAAKYVDWVTAHGNLQHLLVCNWREAKPCIAVLMQFPAASRPSTIIVLCELPNDFKRASRWQEVADIPLELVSSREHLINRVSDLGISSKQIEDAKPDKSIRWHSLESPPLQLQEPWESPKEDADMDRMHVQLEPFLTTWKEVGIDSDIVSFICSCSTTKELEQLLLAAQPYAYFD